jgi:hypothetical protein
METLGSAYGKCLCGGDLDETLVEVRFSAVTPSQVLRDVPQASCPLCGTRIYKSAVLERIEAAYTAAQPGAAR